MIIEQRPFYNLLPVGQDIIFTVSDNTIVATKFEVRFTASLYIDDGVGIIALPINKVADLSVTPNNKGVGIFSLQSILESYVKPQQEGEDFDGLTSSQFKGDNYSFNTPHPIHLIDKYCVNKNVAKYFQIGFNIEYYDTADANTITSYLKELLSEPYIFYNGVLDYDANLVLISGNYGFNLNVPKLVFNDYYGSLGKFLSNAPIEQDARLTDYGTLSFFNFLNTSTSGFQVGTDSAIINMVEYIVIKLYNSSGVLLDSFQVDSTDANGGFQKPNQSAHTKIFFFGAFPANLDGWSTIWDTHKANISYYTIQAFDDVDATISQLYKINIIDNPCGGYEAIRLTWLNPHGTWDYYTFNKKSIKSLQTNRTNYTQQSGTWNEKAYRINGYKGGKKNFRVNTKQLITVNSDFLLESEAIWFEDLINSTEVYILNGYNTTYLDARSGITNKYVEPVAVTTSSYTRKTKANDKLIQYTFQLEKTHNKRTQSV